MANAIWPLTSLPADEIDVDVSERLRKVAIPLMEEIVNHGTVRRLEREMNTENLPPKVAAEEKERNNNKLIPEDTSTHLPPE